jgi:hypothetical protein
MDLITRVLIVSRTVVQVDPKFHPTGDRFLVKEYPKDKEFRRLKLSTQLTAKIAAHVKDGNVGPGDLVFAMAPQDSPPPGCGPCPTSPRSGSPSPTRPGGSTGMRR